MRNAAEQEGLSPPLRRGDVVYLPVTIEEVEAETVPGSLRVRVELALTVDRLLPAGARRPAGAGAVLWVHGDRLVALP